MRTLPRDLLRILRLRGALERAGLSVQFRDRLSITRK